MPLAPNPAAEISESVAVREQLERLSAHTLFANSKRYPAFLGYAVEQALLGNAAELKERNIGVEVFGRSATYDVNTDPVVRITAGEVRKRLTMYYSDSAHDEEWVIDLPVGSYVPVFRAPARPLPQIVETLETPAQAIAPTPAQVDQARPPRYFWFALAGVAALAATAGLGIGLRLRPAQPPPTEIDRFWAPMTAGTATVTYCLGEPAKTLDAGSINSLDTPNGGNSDEQPLYFRLHLSGHLALADVVTLTRTAAALETRHKAFRVTPASEASFAQLREGPIVLIGAFDNIWTLRVTQKLRFGFESKDGVALIVDRKSPSQTTWATAWDLPYKKLSRDYAIVARIHDNTTGQPVIIAAGISEEGTEAAGEILYNPTYLDSLLQKVPSNWEQMNMEAVIETEVIQGHQGPPRVLVAETW